jgi:hypothetical protein
VGHQDIYIEYYSSDTSIDIDPDLPGAFKSTPRVRMQASMQWQEFSFDITDAAFTKRMNTCDYRVVYSRETEGVMYIDFVSVRRNSDLDVVKIFDLGPYGGVDLSADPEVSIIIPFFNQTEFNLQCLWCLSLDTTGRYEVIMVDDGSEPHATGVIETIDGIRLIRNTLNGGFDKACNEGAREVSGKYLLFLNNDTIPQANWLSEQFGCLDRHKNLAAGGSRLLYPDNDEIQHAGVFFEPDESPFHIHRFQPASYEPASRERVVAAVTGACMLTPASVYWELDGFYEAYRNGYEDVDYCLRAHEKD